MRASCRRSGLVLFRLARRATQAIALRLRGYRPRQPGHATQTPFAIHMAATDPAGTGPQTRPACRPQRVAFPFPRLRQSLDHRWLRRCRRPCIPGRSPRIVSSFMARKVRYPAAGRDERKAALPGAGSIGSGDRLRGRCLHRVAGSVYRARQVAIRPLVLRQTRSRRRMG